MDILPNIGFQSCKRTTARGPKRTLMELAEEFGVLPGQLRMAMRNAPIAAPKPAMEVKTRHWYDLKEMRAWWNSIGGKDFAVSKRAAYNAAYAKSST